MTEILDYLDYGPRPAFPPVPGAYHERAAALAAKVDGREYSYGPHKLQKLLLFPATNPTGEVVVAFHGGRFVHGYKEWMAIMAPALNKRGITLVCPGNRLVSADPFPAGIQDCANAVKWTAEHLDEFGGKRDAIFLTGHSSGGFYAALLAIRPDVTGIADIPPVAGCLPVSGLFRIENDQITQQILFPGGSTEEQCNAVSPLLADLRGVPPFHISWGSDDAPPIPVQSAQMVEALRNASVKVEALVMEGADHFDAALRTAEADGEWIRSVEPFLRQNRA